MRGLFLLLAVAGAAQAAEPAQDWLLRMSEAAKAATYQGVVVYQNEDTQETFRVTHRFTNGVERERVQSLTGAPREVVKQGDQTICLTPKTKRMTVNTPTPKGLFPGLTAERVQQLGQVYAFDDLGTQRVAGRSCRGLAVTPRDEFRYGYELWADTETAVPLKVNLIGRNGAVLEQMMFTEVEFPKDIPDSAFADGPPAPAAPAPATATASSEVALPQLPPGFRVVMRDLRQLPNGRGLVEHVLLSDGLSAVSVFNTARQSNRSLTGVSQMGAVHAYGRMVGRFHVTVVGEAPAATVKLIGDSAQPAEPSAQGQEKPQPLRYWEARDREYLLVNNFIN